jgi:hypothetical protein
MKAKAKAEVAYIAVCQQFMNTDNLKVAEGFAFCDVFLI